jgi:phosphinothricin acetyltransferase
VSEIGEWAGVRIDALTVEDWPAVRGIFADGIATRNATFETEPPSWDDWNAAHLREPRVAARDASGLVGWAALTPYSARPAYAGVAEVSIYVAAGRHRRGIGSALLGALVARTEAAGIWTLQAGIFPENVASLRLHVAHGFRVVGVRERIGRLDGDWRDVALLERRSREVG